MSEIIEAPQAERPPTTLHAAAEQFRVLLEQVSEDGELPAEFDAARALVERRAVACVAFIRLEEANVRFILDEAQRLVEHARAKERRCERLKAYVIEHMKATGIKRIAEEHDLFSARLYPDRDEAVVIDEGAKFPPELCRDPPPLQPSKEKIKEKIKAALAEAKTTGQPLIEPIVPGAKLVRRDRLSIR